MKHLTIVVPDGQNNLESIVGSYQIFSRADACWRAAGRSALFEIELAGISKEVGFYDDLFTVKPQTTVSAISKTDLIVIPSLNHNYHEAVKGNEELIHWIQRQYRAGAEVASICTGTFLLAASGLLDGKCCSTHWSAAESFWSMFPDVDVQPDKLITDEDGIYTNGGAYSFLNLIVYLVEKYYDRQTAIYCSKVFQIEMDRDAQSAFIIFRGQKKHDDEVVKQAQEYLEQNLQSEIAIHQLASMFAVSRRQFDRRFLKATGNTPFEYLLRARVEAAKKLLEAGQKTVTEAMYAVGYSDPSAFRKAFKDVTSLSPVDYRNKYNQAAAV